jgi:ABC-2 type transport system ATP-binding protein
MIEHGNMVFSGTMEEFDNYVVPNSLNVTLGNPPAVEELAKLPNVLNIEQTGPGMYRIRFKGDDTITEEIVAASVQGGWRLREITMERCSLDVIFAQLSGKLKNNIENK